METSEFQITERFPGEISRSEVGSVVSIRVRSCSKTLLSLGFEAVSHKNIKFKSEHFIGVESSHMVYENEMLLPSYLQNLCIVSDHEQRVIIRPIGIYLSEFIPRFSSTIDIGDTLYHMIRRLITEIRDFGYSPHNLWASDIYDELIGIETDDKGNFHFFLRDPGLMLTSPDPDDMKVFLDQVDLYLIQFFEL